MKANNQTTRMASLQMAWFFIFFLLAKSTFAFSVGAINGASCGQGKPIRCSVADLLNKSGGAVGSDFYEEVHQHITQDALRQVKYTAPMAPTSIGFSEVADQLGVSPMRQVMMSNAYVDLDQVPYKHCDDEQIGNCVSYISVSTIALKNSLKGYIDPTQAGNLRHLFGELTHTLQDFFSHTNFVKSGSDGAGDATPLWGGSNLEGYPVLPSSVYRPCMEQYPDAVPRLPNLPPYSGELSSQGLDSGYTSGYAWLPLNDAIAPPGKCAHGLLGNGIHKDWSGRDLHIEARARAIQHTREFALAVINDTGNIPDSVCMFMTDKPCPEIGGSLNITGQWRVSNFQGTILLPPPSLADCPPNTYCLQSDIVIFGAASPCDSNPKNFCGDFSDTADYQCPLCAPKPASESLSLFTYLPRPSAGTEKDTYEYNPFSGEILLWTNVTNPTTGGKKGIQKYGNGSLINGNLTLRNLSGTYFTWSATLIK